MDIRRVSPGLTRNAGVREYFMHIHRAGPWWQRAVCPLAHSYSPQSFPPPLMGWAVFTQPASCCPPGAGGTLRSSLGFVMMTQKLPGGDALLRSECLSGGKSLPPPLALSPSAAPWSSHPV